MSDIDILKLMEPITMENIHELQGGDWIWDTHPTNRCEHRRSLSSIVIEEPYGFRQVHVLDLDNVRIHHTKGLLLSADADYRWEYFREGRFYKFKKPTPTHKVKVRKKTKEI